MDFQAFRYGSPALDLVYYLFAATDKKMRAENYHKIIKIYYEQLSINIRAMGSDPEQLFTFEELQSELKRCGNLAIIISPLQLQAFLTNSEDVVDLDEMSEKGESFSINQNRDESYKLLYKQKLNDVITDLVDLGYYRRVD